MAPPGLHLVFTSIQPTITLTLDPSFVTRSRNWDLRFYDFDFFIFKPKLLTVNIFKDELYTYDNCPKDVQGCVDWWSRGLVRSPEHYMADMFDKHKIKFKVIPRFENEDGVSHRHIDKYLKLWHEHDLGKLEQYFKHKQFSDNTTEYRNKYLN